MARLSRLIGLLAVVVLLAPATDLYAQEQQVPLDQDSTLYVVDADLRQDLTLFPDVGGFQEAVLYRIGDDEYELVIQYRPDTRTLRERRTLTDAEVQTLRTRITRQLADTGTVVNLNQEGRYGLLASTTLLSLSEGALLGAALGLEGDGVGTMTLLGGATGFFAPLLLTRNASVTEAEADMTFYSGIQGYAHAAQLYALVNGDDDDTFDDQGTAALAAVLGAGESALGYTLARRNNWSGGHAEMTSFTGLAGNLIGLGLAQGLTEDEVGVRGAAALSFAGSIAGGVIGHRMGRSDTYTQGDARIYLLSGVQTANLVGSVLAAAGVEGEQGPALTVTGAGVAGLAGGRLLVRDRDFTKSEANIVALGNFAGSLLGGGLAAASDAEDSTVAVLQALGSLAGSAISYGVFAKDAQRRAQSGTASVDLDLNVTPSMATVPGPDGRRVRLSDSVVPKVTLTARF